MIFKAKTVVQQRNIPHFYALKFEYVNILFHIKLFFKGDQSNKEMTTSIHPS